MKKIIIPNEAPLIINKLNIVDITRCPNCNLISSLNYYIEMINQ